MTMRAAAPDQVAVNQRGMIAMVCAMGCFILNDTLVKLASGATPPGEIMTIRGTFASMAVFGLLVATGQIRGLGRVLAGPVLVRSVMEAAVAAAFITALAHVELGAITAILQVTPLVLTALSVVLLKETVGWRRWSAVLVGFAGVILIVRPGPEGLDPYALLAVGCAFLVAIRDLTTRRIASATPTLVVTLGTTAAVAIAGLFGAPFEPWHVPDVPVILGLAGAGVAVACGNWFIITAYRGTEVSAVGPFRYSVVVFALIMGYLVFGEVPDLLASFGTLLIVASGLYAAHREAVRRRAG